MPNNPTVVNYGYVHPEFIWFLKTTSRERTSSINSYMEAVMSHLPAVYLEIVNYSVVSLMCFTCVGSHLAKDVNIQGEVLKG